MFANGAITGAFSRTFNDEGEHELPEDDYKITEFEEKSSRMIRERYESGSRVGLLGKFSGFMRDIVNEIKGGVEIEAGRDIYRRELKLQKKIVTYNGVTHKEISSELIGPAYTAIDVTGTPVRGFSYIGNGRYSIPAMSVGFDQSINQYEVNRLIGAE